MTLRRVDALYKHWRRNPPVHVSVAAFMRGGSGSASAAPSSNEGLLEALQAVQRASSLP